VIGIDTNVLARYLVEDDLEQTERARAFLDTACTEETPGFISTPVLCEIVWLLARGYRYDERLVAQTVRRVLSARNLVVQDASVAWEALAHFEAGSADFADYLIALNNRAAGCAYTVTFDRRAARELLFKLLPS
jgi:predicted nucleic-acid-binding protein